MKMTPVDLFNRFLHQGEGLIYCCILPKLHRCYPTENSGVTAE